MTDSCVLFRGGFLVVPDADVGAATSGHASFHSLQLLYRISQVSIVNRCPCTFLFAQCIVDPEIGLVPNGMYSPVGAVRLRHLLGVWY